MSPPSDSSKWSCCPWSIPAPSAFHSRSCWSPRPMSMQWMSKEVPSASSSRNGSTFKTSATIGFQSAVLLNTQKWPCHGTLLFGGSSSEGIMSDNQDAISRLPMADWMQTSSEKHLHDPKILPPSNKMPDAGRQKSIFYFFLTECPGDTFFRGWWWSCSNGADGGRKQAKHKQTNYTPLSILICHELRTPCFISMSWISLGQKKTLRVENERASLATHQPINVWLLIGYIISLILTSWWLMCDAARFCKASWLWVSYQFSLPVFCMRPSLETTSADTYPPSAWIKYIFHHVILGSFPYTSCPSISVFYHHLDWVWTCVSLPVHLWRVESLGRGARPCPWKLPMKVVWLISFASMLARPAEGLAAGWWQIFVSRWRNVSLGFFSTTMQLFPSSGYGMGKNRQPSLFEKYQKLTSHTGKGSEISCAAVCLSTKCLEITS